MSLFAVSANAAVPNSVASLLGPAIGYMMAQSEMCGWNIGDKIKTTYESSLKAAGLTDAQQAAAWQDAKGSHDRLTALSGKGKERMKKDICTDAARKRVDAQLTDATP